MTPDEPVRTSTDSLPGEGQGLAVRETLPGRAELVGSTLPSTQTLTQARPPLIVDDEVDALVGDRHVAGQRGGLALGLDAVTVIVQCPAVSS